MRITSDVAALRSDQASQRRLRLEMERAHDRWCARHEVAAVLADLARYSQGSALHALPTLHRLLTSRRRAQCFVTGWCRDFLGPLNQFPLAQVPFRHHHKAGYSWMQLAGHGSASLTLAVYAQLPANAVATSTVFSDRAQHELVLAGKADACCHRIKEMTQAHARIASERRAIAPGDLIACEDGLASRQIEKVSGRLVLLQLTRVPGAPELTREFALPSGALLKQSSGNKRASQREMAMAVLSAMDRQDAADTIALHANAGPEHLRWEALRHALSLDAQRGVKLLEEIGCRSDDPLAAPAQQLLAQLRAAHPQLPFPEDLICPA